MYDISIKMSQQILLPPQGCTISRNVFPVSDDYKNKILFFLQKVITNFEKINTISPGPDMDSTESISLAYYAKYIYDAWNNEESINHNDNNNRDDNDATRELMHLLTLGWYVDGLLTRNQEQESIPL